jgi:hypothetical protein
MESNLRAQYLALVTEFWYARRATQQKRGV